MKNRVNPQKIKLTLAFDRLQSGPKTIILFLEQRGKAFNSLQCPWGKPNSKMMQISTRKIIQRQNNKSDNMSAQVNTFWWSNRIKTGTTCDLCIYSSSDWLSEKKVQHQASSVLSFHQALPVFHPFQLPPIIKDKIKLLTNSCIVFIKL